MSGLEGAILEIIELLYAAACDGQQWPLVASRCQNLLPGASFSLIPGSEADCHAGPALAGWDPDFIKSYVAHYHTLNCYNDFLRDFPDGKVLQASKIVSKEWREKQVFYQEWLRPQGNYIY